MPTRQRVEKTLLQKIKEAGGHTLIYGIGSILQSALGFLLIPLYTRRFTTAAYGELSLITVCGTLAGVIFYLGASSALARSYYDYDDLEERKKVVSTSFYITLAGAVVQGTLGFMLGERVSVWLFKTPAFHLHVSLALVSSALAFINAFFYLLLRFERLSVHVVVFNLVSLGLSVAVIVWLLVGLKLGVMAPILGGLIAQLVLAIVLFAILRRGIVLGYSAKELRLQIPFGLQAVSIGLAYYSFDWLNRYFINKYGNLSDVGVYTLGFQIGMVVNILLVLPFAQIWAPMRMEYRNDSNAEEFYKRILSYYFIAGVIATAVISTFSRELIMIVAGRRAYVASAGVVPFVMLGLVLYGSVNIIDNGIYFSRKVIYHTYIFWFASLLAGVLNYVFVPRFGYVAAAAVLLVSYCVVVVLVFVVSNRLYPVPYEGRRLSLLFLLGISAIIAGNIVVFPRLWVTIGFKAALIAVLICLTYALILSKDERNSLHKAAGSIYRLAARSLNRTPHPLT